MLDPAFIRRMLVRLVLLFIVCTMLAIYFASASYADYAYRDYEVSWQELLVRSLADWWSWVLLGPVVLLLAVAPGERRPWPLVLLVQIPSGLFCGVATTLIRLGLVGAIYGTDNLRAGMGDIARSVLIYWAIVAIMRGLDAQRRSRERQLQLSRLESQLAVSQLDSLRRQLHPHFLFNTLHAISTLMRRDVDAAEQMIARLGDLLRLALDRDGAQLVTLQEELELLGRYLEIETIRFGDRLEVIYEIDERLRDVMVPNLILQPLVENAVRHGIAARTGPGRIVLRASQHDDVIRLAVIDDGPGLPADQPVTRGVGLDNTQARLAQLYGGTASFVIENAPSGGVAVQLTLPLERSNERDPTA